MCRRGLGSGANGQLQLLGECVVALFSGALPCQLCVLGCRSGSLPFQGINHIKTYMETLCCMFGCTLFVFFLRNCLCLQKIFFKVLCSGQMKFSQTDLVLNLMTLLMTGAT